MRPSRAANVPEHTASPKTSAQQPRRNAMRTTLTINDTIQPMIEEAIIALDLPLTSRSSRYLCLLYYGACIILYVRDNGLTMSEFRRSLVTQEVKQLLRKQSDQARSAADPSQRTPNRS